ncbi:hypothetical protein RQP46_006474 [Phenoliferia psychrophenolica]
MASWNTVLEKYARAKDPRKEIPAGVFLKADSETITIFDGFEKAKYHFLCMPRDPFPSEKKIPSKDLVSLSALLSSASALEILLALKKSAEGVKTMIEDEMLKTEGWVWGVQVGFHASESMRHVHLHIISSDLISPKLKNKKHYNSFHPKLGFFLHLDDVIDQCKQGTPPSASTAFYEDILKEPLVSIYNGDEFKNLPKLKEHLADEWARRGRKAKEQAKAKEGQKRPAGELEGAPEAKKKSPV